MRGRNNGKWYGNPYFAVLMTIIFCVSGSIIAHMLPMKQVKKNIISSKASFSAEASYPLVIESYQGSKLDDFTDALILNAAGYDGKEPALVKAFANFYMRSESPNASLAAYGEETGEEVYSQYARYWFGEVLFVKCLLLVFDYSGIRMLNQIVQLFMLSFFMYSLVKNGLEECCIPFLTAVLLLMPVVVPLSIQFSSVYYVMMVAMIWIVHRKPQFDEKNLGGGV